MSPCFEREALIARARQFLHEPAFDPEHISSVQMRWEARGRSGRALQTINSAVLGDWGAFVPTRAQMALWALGAVYAMTANATVGSVMAGIGMIPQGKPGDSVPELPIDLASKILQELYLNNDALTAESIAAKLEDLGSKYSPTTVRGVVRILISHWGLVAIVSKGYKAKGIGFSYGLTPEARLHFESISEILKEGVESRRFLAARVALVKRLQDLDMPIPEKKTLEMEDGGVPPSIEEPTASENLLPASETLETLAPANPVEPSKLQKIQDRLNRARSVLGELLATSMDSSIKIHEVVTRMGARADKIRQTEEEILSNQRRTDVYRTKKNASALASMQAAFQSKIGEAEIQNAALNEKKDRLHLDQEMDQKELDALRSHVEAPLRAVENRIWLIERSIARLLGEGQTISPAPLEVPTDIAPDQASEKDVFDGVGFVNVQAADRSKRVQKSELPASFQRLLADPQAVANLLPYREATKALLAKGTLPLPSVVSNRAASGESVALSNLLAGYGGNTEDFMTWIDLGMPMGFEEDDGSSYSSSEERADAPTGPLKDEKLELPASLNAIKTSEIPVVMKSDLPASFQRILADPQALATLQTYRNATKLLLEETRNPPLMKVSIQAGNKSNSALNNFLARYGGGAKDYQRWVDLGMPMDVVNEVAPAPMVSVKVPPAPIAEENVGTLESPPSPKQTKTPRSMSVVKATSPKPIPDSVQKGLLKSEKVKRKLLWFATLVHRQYENDGVFSLPATSVELVGKHFTTINSYLHDLHIPPADFLEFVAGLPNVGPSEPSLNKPMISPIAIAPFGASDSGIAGTSVAANTEEQRRKALLKRIRQDDISVEKDLEQLRGGNINAMEALMDLFEANRVRVGKISLSGFSTWYRSLDDRSRLAKDRKSLAARFNGGSKSPAQTKIALAKLKDFFEDEVASRSESPRRVVAAAEEPVTPAPESDLRQTGLPQPTAGHISDSAATASKETRTATRGSVVEPLTREEVENAVHRLNTLLDSTRGMMRKGMEAIQSGNWSGAKSHYESALKTLYSSRISDRLLMLEAEGKKFFGESKVQETLSGAVAADEMVGDVERVLAFLDAWDAYQVRTDKSNMMDSYFKTLMMHLSRTGKVTLDETNFIHQWRMGPALPYTGDDLLRMLNRRIPLVNPRVTVRLASRAELYRMVSTEEPFKAALTLSNEALADQIESGSGASRSSVSERGRLLPQAVAYLARTQPDVRALFEILYPEQATQLNALLHQEESDSEIYKTDDYTAYQERLLRLGLNPSRVKPYEDDEFGAAFFALPGNRASRYGTYHQLMETPLDIRIRFHSGERGHSASLVSPPGRTEEALKLASTLVREALVEVSPLAGATAEGTMVQKEAPEPSQEGSADQDQSDDDAAQLAQTQRLVDKAFAEKQHGEELAAGEKHQDALQHYEEALRLATIALEGGKGLEGNANVKTLSDLFASALNSANGGQADKLAAKVDDVEVLIKFLRRSIAALQTTVLQPTHKDRELQRLVNQYARDGFEHDQLKIRAPEDIVRLAQGTHFDRAIAKTPAVLREQIRLVASHANLGRQAQQLDEEIRLARLLAYSALTDETIHGLFIARFPHYKGKIPTPINSVNKGNEFKNERERELYGKFLDKLRELGFDPSKEAPTPRNIYKYYYGLTAKDQSAKNAVFLELERSPDYVDFRAPRNYRNGFYKKHLFALTVVPPMAGYFFGQDVQALVGVALIAGIVAYTAYVIVQHVRGRKDRPLQKMGRSMAPRHAWAVLGLILLPIGLYFGSLAVGGMTFVAFGVTLLSSGSPLPVDNPAAAILKLLSEAKKSLSTSEMLSPLREETKRLNIKPYGIFLVLQFLKSRGLVEQTTSGRWNDQNSRFQLTPFGREYFSEIYEVFEQFKDRHVTAEVKNEIDRHLEKVRSGIVSLPSATPNSERNVTAGVSTPVDRKKSPQPSKAAFVRVVQITQKLLTSRLEKLQKRLNRIPDAEKSARQKLAAAEVALTLEQNAFTDLNQSISELRRDLEKRENIPDTLERQISRLKAIQERAISENQKQMADDASKRIAELESRRDAINQIPELRRRLRDLESYGGPQQEAVQNAQLAVESAQAALDAVVKRFKILGEGKRKTQIGLQKYAPRPATVPTGHGVLDRYSSFSGLLDGQETDRVLEPREVAMRANLSVGRYQAIKGGETPTLPEVINLGAALAFPGTGAFSRFIAKDVSTESPVMGTIPNPISPTSEPVAETVMAAEIPAAQIPVAIVRLLKHSDKRPRKTLHHYGIGIAGAVARLPEGVSLTETNLKEYLPEAVTISGWIQFSKKYGVRLEDMMAWNAAGRPMVVSALASAPVAQPLAVSAVATPTVPEWPWDDIENLSPLEQSIQLLQAMVSKNKPMAKMAQKVLAERILKSTTWYPQIKQIMVNYLQSLTQDPATFMSIRTMEDLQVMWEGIKIYSHGTIVKNDTRGKDFVAAVGLLHPAQRIATASKGVSAKAASSDEVALYPNIMALIRTKPDSAQKLFDYGNGAKSMLEAGEMTKLNNLSLRFGRNPTRVSVFLSSHQILGGEFWAWVRAGMPKPEISSGSSAVPLAEVSPVEAVAPGVSPEQTVSNSEGVPSAAIQQLLSIQNTNVRKSVGRYREAGFKVIKEGKSITPGTLREAAEVSDWAVRSFFNSHGIAYSDYEQYLKSEMKHENSGVEDSETQGGDPALSQSTLGSALAFFVAGLTSRQFSLILPAFHIPYAMFMAAGVVTLVLGMYLNRTRLRYKMQPVRNFVLESA